MRKRWIVEIVVCLCVLLFPFFYVFLWEYNGNIKKDYAALQQSYDDLQKQYSTLQEDYAALQHDFVSIEQHEADLQALFDIANAEVERLTALVESTKTDIGSSALPDLSTSSGMMVWVPKSGSKYHSTSSCSNMKNPSYVSLFTAIDGGYTACSKCW